jgi:hypothetical protein
MDITLIVVLLLAGMPLAHAESKSCTAESNATSACSAKPKIVIDEIKFKSAITHGQILSAGQKPASTTIEQSEKDLAPSTGTGKPRHSVNIP